MPLRCIPRLCVLLPLALSCAQSFVLAGETTPDRKVLFHREGKNWYRLPSITLTPKGTVLAFSGKRKGSVGDFGHPTDVVLRRSTNGGESFGPEVTVATADDADIHSGPVVIDRHSGRIFKFCRYWPAQGRPQEFVYKTPYSKMVELGWIDHVMTSDDDGRTWTEPKPLPLAYPEDAVSCGTGNGIHGIQLESGRLLIQGGFVPRSGPHADGRVMCLYLSDDGGKTWQVGASMPHSAIREFTLAQLADGSIYYNFRNSVPEVSHRWVGRHGSPGDVFPELALDRQLPEPWCHAGLTFADPTKEHPQGVLFFSNPAHANETGKHSGKHRRDMTLRASFDGGRSWPIAQQINDRPAGYSDLATDARTVHCLFEAGDQTYNERIEYVRLSLERLLRGEE